MIAVEEYGDASWHSGFDLTVSSGALRIEAYQKVLDIAFEIEEG